MPHHNKDVAPCAVAPAARESGPGFAYATMLFACLASAAVTSHAAESDASSLQQEVEELKRQVKSLQEQVQSLKKDAAPAEQTQPPATAAPANPPVTEPAASSAPTPAPEPAAALAPQAAPSSPPATPSTPQAGPQTQPTPTAAPQAAHPAQPAAAAEPTPANSKPTAERIVTLRQNWHQVERGMTKAQINDLLGPPTKELRINEKLVWYYYYKGIGGASVFFNSDGRVSSDQSPTLGLW